MSTLTQQPIPKPFLPIFEKAGIVPKEYATPEAFEADLLVFLRRNHVVHLATCKDNTARSTPLEYRLDGLRPCILSAGGSKFDYLDKNSEVAFSVAEPYDSTIDYWSYRGIQGWGSAEVISINHNPEAFARAFAKMSVDHIFEQLGVEGLFPGMHYRIIRITPERIKYTNPREGVFRVIWKKEG
jgi:hypothetical protein